ncbi:HNH endonuclease [Streptomyces sp. NPDC002886]|uniref:HNH endonuclease n=1 Tax=Streptomyces sp. NPDC002886 TaxID=3364667 RepID=UPI0036B9E4BC
MTAVLLAAGLEARNPGVSAGGDDKASPPGQGKGGAQGAQGAPALPGLSSTAVASTQLSGLKVAGQKAMTGYSREKFTHWTGQGDSCDTREVVLECSGNGVKRDAACKAVSGTWVSVYDQRRKEFANNLTRPQLLVVSAATSRAKGDQGPEDWQPPAKGYWCTHATAWTNVKSTYQLTVTEGEKKKLTEMLETCS